MGNIVKWTRIGVGILAAAVLFPVVGEFCIDLAKEHGFYEHPSQRLAAMMTYLDALVGASWFHWAGGAIIGLAAGVWLDALLRRKLREPLLARAKIDLTGLADEAQNLAKGINELLGETHRRPPTHPKFARNTELWQQEGHEREESAIRQFRSKYATDVFRILETSSKYIEITKQEVWSVSHLSGSHDLDALAQLLSRISSRLREIEI